MDREVTAGKIFAARVIAVAADLVLMISPTLWGGVFNPLGDAIDILVAIVLSYLLGLHWVFLPGFLMELIPVVEVAPSWTVAVLIATRKRPAAPPTSVPKSGRVIDIEVPK